MVCLTVLAGVGASAASADDYQFMNPKMLQQAVLRAQMPYSLGSWDQNLYYTDTDTLLTQATLCWGSKGPIRLPAAKNVGAVGYNVDQFTSGAISIFQFKNQADADQARAAMQSAACSDSPLVPTESEKLVQGTSGSDQTDASFTGLIASESHVEDGIRATQTVITTFRGLAAVQTQVFRAAKLPQSAKSQQQTVNKLEAANKKWQAKAIKALENFGTGIAR